MKSTHTVLIRPPVDVLHKFSKPVECLALGYLASAIRCAGHRATLIDAMLMGWSAEMTIYKALACDPDVIGFTVVLNYFPKIIETMAILLRESGFGGLIIVGGHAVSFFPDRILHSISTIDGVVTGEGEVVVQKLSDAIAVGDNWRNVPGLCTRVGGDIRRNPVIRNHHLDLVPVPARDLTQEVINRDGLVAISTSRGCYARCSFCSVPRFYGLSEGRPYANGSWIARSVEHTVREMESLYNTFRLHEILIVDDEFFGGTEDGFERARSFGMAMESLRIPLKFAMSCRAENIRSDILEQLIKGGLAHIFIGLESGMASDLKLYGKGHTVEQNIRAVETVKGLGLSFQPGFMLFNFDSDLSRIRGNLDFLESIGELKPVTINSSVDPHFGTPLALHMDRREVLIDQGLQLSVRFKDRRVFAAKTVAERAALAFDPFMNFIAAAQSSVTYEWRRRVPGRDGRVQRVIDILEKKINTEFSKIVIKFVELLIEFSGNDPMDIVVSADDAISESIEILEDMQLMTVAYAESLGDRIRYRTQNDSIDEFWNKCK